MYRVHDAKKSDLTIQLFAQGNLICIMMLLDMEEQSL